MHDFHEGELELAIKDRSPITMYHTWATFRMRLSSVNDNPQSQQKKLSYPRKCSSVLQV